MCVCVQVTLHSYNWSLDLGAALSRDLVRLVRWQNARAHVVHCLLSQKMGLFHHHCFSDAPIHESESKQVKTHTHTHARADLGGGQRSDQEHSGLSFLRTFIMMVLQSRSATGPSAL